MHSIFYRELFFSGVLDFNLGLVSLAGVEHSVIQVRLAIIIACFSVDVRILESKSQTVSLIAVLEETAEPANLIITVDGDYIHSMPGMF